MHEFQVAGWILSEERELFFFKCSHVSAGQDNTREDNALSRLGKTHS